MKWSKKDVEDAAMICSIWGTTRIGLNDDELLATTGATDKALDLALWVAFQSVRYVKGRNWPEHYAEAVARLMTGWRPGDEVAS